MPQILACGHGGIGTLFLSMAQRHPGGADADYLRWHTLDHRPEQQRLAAIRTSLRAVSTPACRAARAACEPRFDAVDHVMTYFFATREGLADFGELSRALRDAGRAPCILPPVERGVYEVTHKRAAARTRTGADVLPWMPVRGIYLLIEEGREATAALEQQPGIAGLWVAESVATDFSGAAPGQRLTCCFLDGDPVETATALRPVLEGHWQSVQTRPLFAAPFHTVVPYEWERYLP